jgi:alkylhydroperoxidase family enzyme
MPRIPLSNVGGNVYERLMGHRPEILESWFALDATIRFAPTLNPDLKEEVRRSMAPGIGCVFCSTLGTAADAHPDRKEALAVAFAERVVEDWRSIDDAAFAVLGEEFSTDEIVELVAWISFIFGAQLFGALLQTTPATPQELEAYAEWRQAGNAAGARS